jgi:threonine/homoserine/homoserine lactone efflux protein
MNIFLQNIILGLSIAAPVGPASITIIKNGLKYGFLSAWISALGIVFVDFFYFLAVYFGISYVMSNPIMKILLQIYGTTILLYMGYLGIKDFFQKKVIDFKILSNSKAFFLQGISINLSNPLAIVYWTGVYASILITTKQTTKIEGLFLGSGIVFGILIWHTGLSFVSHWAKSIFKEKNVKYISLISGIIFLYYGIIIGLKLMQSFIH